MKYIKLFEDELGPLDRQLIDSMEESIGPKVSGFIKDTVMPWAKGQDEAQGAAHDETVAAKMLVAMLVHKYNLK
jgi:hypothetical protein